MGWPQQLDVRLDGRLLKRFSVGGKAQGRPAAASYAGDGEPGFAGDDSWEKYMQIGGDAGLEVRVPVEAGPHVVGVSFVREMWEPEGLPQPLQRGRVITNDQVYMDYANVGSVQIGGPYTKSAATGEGHAEPPRDFRLSAEGGGGRTGLRHEDPFAAGAARLSAAGDRAATCRRCSTSSTPAGATAEISTPAFNSRSNGCWSIRTSSCASTTINRRRRAERCRSRLAAVVLPVEQHPRRSPADARRAGDADEPVDPRTGSAADAGGPARHRGAGRQLRRPVAEPAPRRGSGRGSGALSRTTT